jgi:hypothetical protein
MSKAEDEDIFEMMRPSPPPAADVLRAWIVEGTGVAATPWTPTPEHNDAVYRELEYLYTCRTELFHLRFLQQLHAQLRDLQSIAASARQPIESLLRMATASNALGLPTHFPGRSLAHSLMFFGMFEQDLRTSRSPLVQQLHALIQDLSTTAAKVAAEIASDLREASNKKAGARGRRQHRALKDVRWRLSQAGMKPAEVDRAIKNELKAFEILLDTEGLTKRKSPKSTPSDTRRATRRARGGK